MTPKGWARVRRAGAHGLRRGAWYAVVNNSKPSIVVLDVNKRNIAIDRSLLEFVEGKPERWSVVVREPGEPGTMRASDANLGATYGVCPNCRTRVNLMADEPLVACPGCSADFEVDWANPC